MLRRQDGCRVNQATVRRILRARGFRPSPRTGYPLADVPAALADPAIGWAGAAEVYVVDAVCSGGTPGTVYQFDATDALTDRFQHRGTHMLSLADVIELARALGRLPGHLTGYGIEGASFAIGDGLSKEAAAAVDKVASLLLNDLKAGVSRLGT